MCVCLSVNMYVFYAVDDFMYDVVEFLDYEWRIKNMWTKEGEK